MNKINQVLNNKENIFNVFVTAGYPKLNDTIEIVQELERNGVDMIEIGMPFSDPLADGPTIQHSSEVAIKNGISVALIFEQIMEIRKTVDLPIILMGYYNQVLQYGADAFFNKAKEVGVDGFIIPDLPLEVYQKSHKQTIESLGLNMIFLITPQTSDDRIRLIDAESSGFVYMVSSYSITGSKQNIEENQRAYFKRIREMELSNPQLIGFGIFNKSTFEAACENAQGAIIGSAFINVLATKNIKTSINNFVNDIL